CGQTVRGANTFLTWRVWPARPEPKQRSRKRAAAQSHTSQDGKSEPPFLVLVAEDYLFFRIAPTDKMSAVVVDERAPTHDGALNQSFREAFANVWARIPVAERCGLLRYWSRQPMFLRSGEPPILAKIKPLIQILDNSAPLADAGCQRAGMELNFHASLVR